MIGIQDEAFQARDLEQQAYDAYHDRCIQYARAELRHAVFTDNVTNHEFQVGKPLHWPVLKAFVEKQNPQLRIERHPHKSDKVCFYRIYTADPWQFDPVSGRFGGERKDYLFAGETFAPEWTLHETSEAVTPHNTRRAEAPQDRTRIPGRIAQAGWRQALARLVGSRLLPLPAVERFVAEHGSASRESWQRHAAPAITL